MPHELIYRGFEELCFRRLVKFSRRLGCTAALKQHYDKCNEWIDAHVNLMANAKITGPRCEAFESLPNSRLGWCAKEKALA